MSAVKDIDKGYRRIMKEIRQMDDAYVKIGYLADSEKHKNSNATVAEVAIAMEYGVPDKNIPARPFFSTSFDKHREKYEKKIRQYVNLIYAGRMNVRRSLSLLGAEAKGDVQKNIREGRWEPLSERTIAKKGSSQPLIDTGQMRASVQYEIGGLRLPKEKG